MATMSNYCKAYPTDRLQQYDAWKKNTQYAGKEKRIVNGKEIEVKQGLDESGFLYLHDNFVVTSGIFVDQDIVFDDVTEEWKDFCQHVLGFKVGSSETEKAQE
jgi:hypothetical protein